MTASDDREAFSRLLEQHAGIVRKVAASYAWNPEDRRELMQEISLQLWRAWPRYAPDRPFSTWMYRVALNVAISWLRGSGNRQQTVSLHEHDLDIADESPAVPEEEENLALLQRLIASLDPLNRALLLLYLDDRSYRDIAGILGISETNVATKLSRIKQGLRTQLSGEKA